MPGRLTIIQRARIFALWQNGARISHIAKDIGIARRTVYWWIKRRLIEGDECLKDRPRAHRGRATTVEQDRAILQAHAENPSLSTRDSASQYQVSMQTIRRRLNSKDKATTRKQNQKNSSVQGLQLFQNNTMRRKTKVKNKDISDRRGTKGGTQGASNQNYKIAHNGLQCTFCERDIVGHRYRCLQCPDVDLCKACENTGYHADHCVLRVPYTALYNKVMPCLEPVMMALNDQTSSVQEWQINIDQRMSKQDLVEQSKRKAAKRTVDPITALENEFNSQSVAAELVPVLERSEHITLVTTNDAHSDQRTIDNQVPVGLENGTTVITINYNNLETTLTASDITQIPYEQIYQNQAYISNP